MTSSGLLPDQVSSTPRAIGRRAIPTTVFLDRKLMVDLSEHFLAVCLFMKLCLVVDVRTAESVIGMLLCTVLNNNP